MYHAVMEEVARFLERCYHSFETIQKNGQMARSCSINHMFTDHPHPNQPLRSASVDLNKNVHRVSLSSLDKSQANSTGTQQLNDSFTSTSTTSTGQSNDIYNNFTDFTW